VVYGSNERNLRTNNPKEYWKILNSGRHKKQPNISIENLLQFKKIIFVDRDYVSNHPTLRYKPSVENQVK
jgi:hypothetical protein